MGEQERGLDETGGIRDRKRRDCQLLPAVAHVLKTMERKRVDTKRKRMLDWFVSALGDTNFQILHIYFDDPKRKNH